MNAPSGIAVVIPCYRVRAQILDVLDSIGPEARFIFVIDDACPEKSGEWVKLRTQDPRVVVVEHTHNRGVGAATMTGYRHALAGGAEVAIKLDGDGQMDARLIRRIASPLLAGQADYAKGNRFHRLSFVKGMPAVRLVGNAGLSLLTKLSSGYWQSVDPTNGYTALRIELVKELDLERISRRYFFESDLLYHLGQAGAVVVDVPMPARYQEETSSLRPWRVIAPFLHGHLRNTARRIGYTYLLRGFSIASVELVLGILLVSSGSVFGAWHWMDSSRSGIPATAGTVMVAALPIIVGIQMLMSWLNFDVHSEPRHPVHPLLRDQQSTHGTNAD